MTAKMKMKFYWNHYVIPYKLWYINASLIFLGFLVGRCAYGAPEGLQLLETVDKLNWEDLVQTLAIVYFPFIVGMTLTVISTTAWRKDRVSRKKRTYQMETFKVACVSGALYGPLSQIGLQSIIDYIFSLPTFWTMLVFATIATGPCSLIWYEVLRWTTRKFHMYRLHAWLSVKKYNPDTNTFEDEEVFVKVEG